MRKPISHDQAHQEHREWNRQHVHWLEDLELWVKDLDQASEKLRWTLENMGKLGTAYGAHRETMVAQEQEIAHHEHHLRIGQSGPDDVAAHELSRKAQDYQHSFHQALRQEHQRFMSLVSELEAIVASAVLR